MEGVSICITAYKVQYYIKECLDSVVNQSWFKDNDNFEIIVGIDGCEDTLEYMKTIMHNYKNLKVCMMDSNKGTYITSNTIMSMAKYENVFRFDSDDIMCNNLVETVMKERGDSILVRYYLKDFGDSKNEVALAHGPIYIKKSIFLKYGGFRPWPCGADTELYYRLKNIENVKNIKDILMLRRVHNTSLTRAKDTGYKSELRKKYKKLIKEMSINTPEDAKIKMETNTYKEISMGSSVDVDAYIKRLGSGKIIHEKADEKVKPKHQSEIKKTTLSQLRNDIQAGRVVKVPTNGGFIWKRIK